MLPAVRNKGLTGCRFARAVTIVCRTPFSINDLGPFTSTNTQCLQALQLPSVTLENATKSTFRDNRLVL